MQQPFLIFGRRLLVILAFQAILTLLLIGRLFFLQIIDQQKYQGLSDRNRIRVTLKPALRGTIRDRYGALLAHSVPYYTAHVTCKTKQCKEHCQNALISKGFDFDPTVFQHNDNKPFVLKSRLTWDEITLLESYKSDLPMVEIQTLYERSYPMDAATPHFLGYTSRIPEDHAYAKKLPFATVGRSGLEKILDTRLFGVPALLEEEVNAYGDTIRTVSHKEGIKGEDLTLTLDQALQSYVYQQLTPHKSGAGVVLDATSGDVLALVSYPSFNPGIFERGLSNAEWTELQRNIQKPLLDKALMGLYPPGSIIKPLIMLAALEEGYITPETRFTCTGVTVIDSQPCHCWKADGHGSVNLSEALRGSCNIYMYEIAKLVPVDVIAKWLKRFGLGSHTGLGIPGEQKGLVPSPSWKEIHRKDRWRRIDTVYSAIGQGYLLATPIQLAKMMAQIVNGGNTITPNILLDKPSEITAQPLASNRYLKIITQAMGQVINHPKGTGYRSRPTGVPWQMGGKSGTAQVRKITRRERAEGRHHGFDWNWQERDHSLFVGFAPLDSPKYVVVVLVEHGGFGSVTAAPIGRDIMKYVMRRFLTPH
jgi:penicillin-binding protein 2